MSMAAPHVEIERRPRSARLTTLDPLHEASWDSLLEILPQSSFFHRSEWARVLHETYGHTPVYVCRVGEGGLEDMLPFMEVASSIFGKRGVSLPFSDFCPALNPGHFDADLFQVAVDQGRCRGWRQLELRGNGPLESSSRPSVGYYGHIVELGGGPETVFARFDSAVRRGIRKAQQSGLRVDFGNNMESVHEYYALHCSTRRRHGLPPQPVRFFENIARYVLEPGYGFVVTARHHKQAVASAIFFHHHEQAIYKYGASDYASQGLRPNNLVMWEALARYSANGFKRMHFGRTSLSNEGLRRFKVAFGAVEYRIEYHKYNPRTGRFVEGSDRAQGWFNEVFRLMPRSLARISGELIYPHLS
jgi:hypothetical protein